MLRNDIAPRRLYGYVYHRSFLPSLPMLALYGTNRDRQNFLFAEDEDSVRLFIYLFISLLQRRDP